MSKRFYHIAFELGVRPRAFIRELADVGLSVGNQMVIVPEALEERIREVYETLHPTAEAPAGDGIPTAAETVEAPHEPDVPAEAPAEAVPAAHDRAAHDQAAHDQAADEQAADDRAAEEQPAEAPAEEPVTAEAPAQETEAAAAAEEAAETPRQGKKRPENLVPTLDPRAGRLVSDAPRGGIPGVTTPRRRPVGGGPLEPSIGQPDRAPGARREGGRRAPARPYARKRGKETFHMRRRPRGKSRPAAPKVRPTSIDVELPITVKRFCELSTYKAAEIIKILFKNHKIMVTPNSVLDRETVEILSIELEMDVNFVERETQEEQLLKRYQVEEKAEDLQTRPPIVTILGHVDHGKTTLLDYVRQSDTAAREAGGITQHIASCQITLEDGRQVTFIDTPGHEAFTEMRSRGAQVTDVVILIVAGDDGVMPQTIEAISHAKAAEVDIVVAVTKADKDSFNAERVKQQLAEHEVYVEGYGGDVSCFEVSGVTGQGVQELLEHLALMAEVDEEKFRANPEALATGTVLESQSNPKRGILTTVLVQNGSLEKGDALLAGEAFGTVRGLFDDKGRNVKIAGPSTPVEITGLSAPPEAGSKFYEVETPAEAKKIAEDRLQRAREEELAAQAQPSSIEALFGKIETSKVETVNLIVKADVGGSLQPLKTVLERLSNDEVRVKILHAGVGPINESDVSLANASEATIIGFHVNADAKAREMAKEKDVNWKTYKVIYAIEEDVSALMEGRLAPEMVEEIQGQAEILAIFTFSKVGNIAGCRVRNGHIRRDSSIRVLRDGELIHDTKIAALRREKDDVKEVKEGFECGITLKGFDEFQEGDILEAYTIKAIRRKLGDAKRKEKADERQDDDAA